MSDNKKASRRRYDEDYEPEPNVVDCPDNIDDTVRAQFDLIASKLMKKIGTAFKGMGWRIDYDIADHDIEDGVQRIEYDVELSVKGGQKLIVDRKKIVADGNYRPSFLIRFLSDQGDTEQDTFEEEYWSGRHDDYDLSTRSEWVEYTCGGVTLDFFEIESLTRGSVSKKMERSYYTERDIARFVAEYTKSFFLNNSRSKWKKRASLIADRYMERTADSQLVDEDGYEVWRDYSGRHTYLKWSKKSSGSGVPQKFKPAWKSLKRLGDYLLSSKSFGLVFDTSTPSAQIDFHDNDTDDWKLVVRNVVITKDGEKWGRWRIKKELPKGWYGKDIKAWNKENEKLVKRALRGLSVTSFSFYDDTLTLRISRPNLRSQASRTEVSVPSGTGDDREMVLSALENQLGSYPSDFEVLRITPFEDDEDIVEVQYRMASHQNVSSRFLAKEKGQ